MAVDFRPKIGGSGVGKSLATSEIIVRNLQHNGAKVILKFYFKFDTVVIKDNYLRPEFHFPTKLKLLFLKY